MMITIIIIVLEAQNIICASLKYMKEVSCLTNTGMFLISLPISTIIGKHATLHVM